jgi:hypothetical protein
LQPACRRPVAEGHPNGFLAVMERLGVTRVASFDDHFAAVYRYGRKGDRAFEVLR